MHDRPPLTQQQVKIILEKELSGKSPEKRRRNLAAEKSAIGQGSSPSLRLPAWPLASLTVPVWHEHLLRCHHWRATLIYSGQRFDIVYA